MFGIRIITFAVLVDATFDPLSFCFAWTCPENIKVREIEHHKQEPPFVLDGHVSIPMKHDGEEIHPHCWQMNGWSTERCNDGFNYTPTDFSEVVIAIQLESKVGDF